MSHELIDAVNNFGPYFFSCEGWSDQPCTPEHNIHNHLLNDKDLRCNITMIRKNIETGEITNISNAVVVSSIPQEWKNKMGIKLLNPKR